MAKTTKSQRKSSWKQIKPKDNSDLKVPSDVMKSIRARQKNAVAEEVALQNQNQARSETDEERTKKEELAARITQKLNIHQELNGIRGLKMKRVARWRKALNKWRL